MKATIEIPDDIYRQVKSRTALEGLSLRSVAIDLFQRWLSSSSSQPTSTSSQLTSAELAASPWLSITQPYLRPHLTHYLTEIRSAISRSWAAEASPPNTHGPAQP